MAGLAGRHGWGSRVCFQVRAERPRTRLAPFAAFPYGTLAVNVAGCLAVGVLGGLTESRQILGPDLRLFLFLGLLGGFTTLSTFGYETMALLRDSEQLRAAANVLMHVFAGLFAVWLGYSLSRMW